GWTLNTDEVELVTEADLAPVQPAKIAAALKAPPVIARESKAPGKATKLGVPVTVPEDRSPTPPEAVAVAPRPAPPPAEEEQAAAPTIQADAPVLPIAQAAGPEIVAPTPTAQLVTAAASAPTAAALTAATLPISTPVPEVIEKREPS